jgi:hypothetical protein
MKQQWVKREIALYPLQDKILGQISKEMKITKSELIRKSITGWTDYFWKVHRPALVKSGIIE